MAASDDEAPPPHRPGSGTNSKGNPTPDEEGTPHRPASSLRADQKSKAEDKAKAATTSTGAKSKSSFRIPKTAGKSQKERDSDRDLLLNLAGTLEDNAAATALRRLLSTAGGSSRASAAADSGSGRKRPAGSPATPAGAKRSDTKPSPASRPTLTKSFAEAVATTSTKDNPDSTPHAQHIHSGRVECSGISEADWKYFCDAFDQRFNKLLEEGDAIHFRCGGRHLGAFGGVFFCLDADSAKLVKDWAEDIMTPEGQTFRSWSNGEREGYKLSFYLPADCKIGKDKIISVLRLQNGLRGVIHLLSYAEGPHKDGHVVTVSVDASNRRRIEEQQHQLFVGAMSLKARTPFSEVVPSAAPSDPPEVRRVEKSRANEDARPPPAAPTVEELIAMSSRERNKLKKLITSRGGIWPDYDSSLFADKAKRGTRESKAKHVSTTANDRASAAEPMDTTEAKDLSQAKAVGKHARAQSDASAKAEAAKPASSSSSRKGPSPSATASSVSKASPQGKDKLSDDRSAEKEEAKEWVVITSPRNHPTADLKTNIQVLEQRMREADTSGDDWRVYKLWLENSQKELKRRYNTSSGRKDDSSK